MSTFKAQLDELDRLEKERTQGEWRAGRSDVISYGGDGIAFKTVYMPEDSHENPLTITCKTVDPIADANFIALSANIARPMIEHIRAQDAEIARLREALFSIDSVETMKTTTDDDEIEWWLNSSQIKDIIDEALAIKPDNETKNQKENT